MLKTAVQTLSSRRGNFRKVKTIKTGVGRFARSRFVFLAVLLAASGCAVVTPRPVQLMSDTSAALRAARDVQAETLAPELYRQASENFNRARQEYKFKNFKEATEFALRARKLAEEAEFQAIRGGGKGVEPPPPEAPQAAPSPYAYPTPTGTPAERFGQPDPGTH